MIAIALICLAVIAGASSYRKWKTVSERTALLQAEGRERRQFIALAGLFMSLTLGFGMLWFCLPLFIIQICLRVR